MTGVQRQGCAFRPAGDVTWRPMPRTKKVSELTVGEVAFLNLRPRYGDGMLGTLKATKKAAEAVAVPACLAIASLKGAAADGTWPTQAEYAAWWKQSERQAQREWALFKEAFPGQESPDAMAKVMAAEIGGRLAASAHGNPSAGAALRASVAGVDVAVAVA